MMLSESIMMMVLYNNLFEKKNVWKGHLNVLYAFIALMNEWGKRDRDRKVKYTKKNDNRNF